MKKTLFILVLLLSLPLLLLFGQSAVSDPIQEPIVPYRLFKTTNRWTFIQLETATGKMWQIQYDIQGNNRGGSVLNSLDLSKDKGAIIGRFTLYPTENMWTFILLDQIDGRTWQVQWSIEKEDRFTIPIFQ